MSYGEPLAKRLCRRATQINHQREAQKMYENKEIAEREIPPLIQQMKEIVEKEGSFELRVDRDDINPETIRHFREEEEMDVYEYCIQCGIRQTIRDASCRCSPYKCGVAFNWRKNDQPMTTVFPNEPRRKIIINEDDKDQEDQKNQDEDRESRECSQNPFEKAYNPFSSTNQKRPTFIRSSGGSFHGRFRPNVIYSFPNQSLFGNFPKQTLFGVPNQTLFGNFPNSQHKNQQNSRTPSVFGKNRPASFTFAPPSDHRCKCEHSAVGDFDTLHQ